MTTRPTLKQRLQYAFDNLMARGTPAMIGMLAVFSLVIVLFAGGVIYLLGLRQEGSDPISFGEASWAALMRTLDAGTMGGDTGGGFRVVMFLVTLGGIFIVSTLIGVLSNAVEEKLDELRKGRSLVLEQDHTIILGWSPQIFTIIPELVTANENRKKAVIAILADQDKVEMEDEIAARVPDMRNTRVICRSGSPIDPTDLEIVSPHSARAIIILRPEGGEADSFTIKSMLALTNNPKRRAEPYHIVTQIDSQRDLGLLRMIGQNDHLHALLMGDLIARVTAQTSRQSGLSVVYTELLNFGGDEIYMREEPALVGQTYAEALLRYEDSAVIGLQHKAGTRLNPEPGTRIQPGDRIIAITADDDTLRLSALAAVPVKTGLIRPAHTRTPARPERALLLGWNANARTIVSELDHYVAPGSNVLVVADESFRQEIAAVAGLHNQSLAFRPGDTTDRALLDSLQIMDFDHVIVLARTDLEVQAADARTLITLLHLRDISERDETPFSIVSEMLDLRNRELAEVARVDDFIVSDHLISLMLAQLSENGSLFDVFTDLFDPEGAEIYLKPAGDYIEIGKPVNFYTLAAAASQRGETAFGYRLAREAKDAGRAYGVHTNPRKSEEVVFQAEDKVIVLAEN